MGGWVKLHRSIWAWRYSPGVTGKPFSKMEAWLWLITKANYEDRMVGEVPVKRGQYLTSQVKLATTWKWSRDKVRRFMECLENGSEIRQQTIQHKYTLITLLNYPVFQGNDTANDTGNKTPNRQVTIHNEEVKKERNKKKSLVGTEAYRLSDLLLSLILGNNPKVKQPNLEKWAQTIDRMIRLDGRTPTEIELVIRWCQADDFWMTNILSADKLRKQFDQLSVKMSRDKPKKNIAQPTWHDDFTSMNTDCTKCSTFGRCVKANDIWLCRTCYEAEKKEGA